MSPTAKEIASEFGRISQLTAEGKKADAWRAANALHAKYPSEAVPNFTIALILVENNQKSDALAYAEAAVKLAPQNAYNKVFLGKLYVDLGMIEFASELLHEAFAMDRTLFHAPWALALYYWESGQGTRALSYFDQALKVAPIAFNHAIKLDKAECLCSLGRWDEAEPDLLAGLEIPKYRARALSEIALLANNEQTPNYIKLVQKELKRSNLSRNDRSSLFLSLGRLYEKIGEYDDAFLSFSRSRKLLHSKFNMEKFVALVDDSIEFLSAEIFEKFKGFGHWSDKPIFVVGMPRSGTTMTEQIIAAHSYAEGVGELERMSRIAEKFTIPNGARQLLGKMTEAGPDSWKDTSQKYLNLLDALAPNARHTVDKMPHNFLYLGFILLCFPRAKIIHCKRDPLDTFISSFQNQMRPFHSYAYDQTIYGEYYIHYLRLMGHWKAVLPGSIHELQYESLVTEPESEVRKMLDFLGFPWEDGCLKFNERGATVRTFSTLQVRRPFNTQSIARWRNYEKHLGPIIAILEQLREQYGLPHNKMQSISR